jgi:hypothetical protein
MKNQNQLARWMLLGGIIVYMYFYLKTIFINVGIIDAILNLFLLLICIYCIEKAIGIFFQMFEFIQEKTNQK